MAVVTVLLIKNRFPAFLRNRELPVGCQVAVSRQWNRFDECHHVRQLFLVESFRVKQKLRDAWPALCFQVGVVSVPFVWSGLGDSPQGAIGYSILAKLGCLQ